MANVFDGVNINKLNGQLGNTAPSTDNVFILIYAIASADLPSGVANHSVNEILQPQDAKNLGFTESFDANESVRILGTIEDFFSYNPEGKLYLVPVNVGASPSEILALDGVKAAIRTAADAKGIAIAGTAETAIELAADAEDVQAEIAAFALEHRLIDFVLLQGNHAADPDDWAIGDLVDLRTLNAPNVSICIAQDPFVAAQDAAYAQQADIGSCLGMIGVRRVNENLGSVNIDVKPSAFKADPNYTLTRGNRWKKAKLSNGVDVATISPTTQTAITNKGYIFVGSYAGYTGMFFNDSPTAVVATSDYNRIENNRTWNKAARAIRLALMPYVKGKVKKDPQTGFIRSTTISTWHGVADKALEAMEIADEISGRSVYIDPKQLPSPTNPLKIKATVVKDGIAHTFDVDLGLANNV